VHIIRMRVWLPDRPGALGAVASRIGGVKGDVVGIEILEQGGGRAVDDLVVALPDASLVDLLVAEVGEVDGVDVEEVVAIGREGYDPDLDALEAAAALVTMDHGAPLLEAFCAHVELSTNALWTCVVDLEHRTVLAANGPAPSFEWVHAFVVGSQTSDLVRTGRSGPDDVLCALLGQWGAVVLGRDGHPFRARERRRINALGHVLDARFRELAR
jgi:hypothetical protein